MSEGPAFWEQPEQVEKFAGREADLRLAALVEQFDDPGGSRVLDLGCAGGRNTVFLAERGFDVHAVDASEAMVDRTRARLSEVLGVPEAERRVHQARMEDLGLFPDDRFVLVVALGVYHTAPNVAAWEQALGETARVLTPEGRVLVANFTPRTTPGGRALRPVTGEPHVYEGFDAGRSTLLEATELDAAFAAHGLLPVESSKTVERPSDQGRRVTVNALYRLAS